MKLFLLYGDGFEQKRFALHVHGHLGHFPAGRSDFGPFHGELSALFEMTEQTSGELNFVHELAPDGDQMLLLGVDPNLARHFVKNLSLTRRRTEGRVRLEGQFDSVATFAGVFKEKRVRNHLEKGIALFRIFLRVCSSLRCSSGSCESLSMRSVSSRCWPSLTRNCARPLCR